MLALSHPFANREARLVVLHGLGIVATLRRDGADEVQHVSDAGFLAQRSEFPRGAIEPSNGLVEAALLARHFASAVSHEARFAVVGRASPRRAIASPSTCCGALPVADELQHLRRASAARRRGRPAPPTAPAARNSRSRPGSRSEAWAASPARPRYSALLRQILAAPVWCASRSRWRSMASALGFLDVAADALVQHRPDRVRHALVRDFLRHDVLEEIRLSVSSSTLTRSFAPSVRRSSSTRSNVPSSG